MDELHTWKTVFPRCIIRTISKPFVWAKLAAGDVCRPGTCRKDVFSDREKVTRAEAITMCCGRVGISRTPIDVVSGHYSNPGITALAKKMLFKLADKSHATESHSLIYPPSLSAKAGALEVSKTLRGQNRELNRWGTGGRGAQRTPG